MKRVLRLCCLIVAMVPWPGFAADQRVVEQEFFEMRIRPILANKCFACHTQSQLGGLRMDSREALLKGGKSGPAIIPGRPEDSLLIRAVRFTEERLKMPMGGEQLKDQEIADLVAWVQSGAYWPEGVKAPSESRPLGKYVISPQQRNFWSFQPVLKPPLPKVKDKAWVRSPIDTYVLSQMEAKNLRPVKQADKRTWIRRATYDLTGLPPKPEEVDAFLQDSSTNAYSRVIERLLASPRYGERWGRYWLDVVRYTDDRYWPEPYMEPLTNAFRYRDWVISAFNQDMPYDRFIKAQIAGDLIDGKDRASLVSGLGLYALTPDYNDDRVDVTTRGFLGLTVACAQCHDHKFDPIPTQDFYSLQGIFNNTEPSKFPLASDQVVNEYETQKKRIKDQEASIKEFLGAQNTQLGEILASRTRDYLLATWQVIGAPAPRLDLETAAQTAKLDVETLGRWVEYVKTSPKDHQLLKPLEDLLVRDVTETEAREICTLLHDLVLKVMRDKKEIEKKNAILLGASKEPASQVSVHSLEREPYFLWRDLFSESYGKSKVGVLHYVEAKIGRFLNGIWKEHLNSLQAELAQLKSALPPEYPFYHTINDVNEPKDMRVHLRGNPDNLGETAPRRFLAILSGEDRPAFSKGSGRLELAEAIASSKNPLTTRVIVNRVWHYHFGSGIVRSLSNFGQLGDRPSHPELLDYLASRFVESGWSLKALHREIMLSATYGLSADLSEANFAVDPDNRLLWRQNRRRLDVESMRDSVLSASGELELRAGGPPKLLVDERDAKPAMGSQVRSLHPPPPQSPGEVHTHRTVYGYVSRTVLDEMLSLFDFPNPNSPSEQRTVTTVPLQRLFLLNSRWMLRQSDAFVKRLCMEVAGDDTSRIRQAYRILYGREPNDEERTLGLRFLANDPKKWPGYAQALLSSNEFLYVD